MSGALDVRDLWVLFAGAPQPSPVDGSIRVMLLDAQHQAMLREFPGFRLGLCDVGFRVDAGDCLAVLGESGSGKSSLLRTLAGLQPQGRGRIVVNDRDVAMLPAEQRGIVYLHQEPVLFPHLSVMENVIFPMTVRGMATAEAERRAWEVITRLGVSVVGRNDARALSGGQRHRVALARALCANPGVLLLDEPLSSLDPAIRRDVRGVLQEARQLSGAATVLVTHDLDDAMTVATHIAVIDQFGRLTTPMRTSEILAAPPSLHAARLLGVFSEILGDVRGGMLHWSGGVTEVPAATDGPVTACVRPHGIVVQRASGEDQPLLTVTARRELAHNLMLDLRDASNTLLSVRVSSGTSVDVGDAVHVTLLRPTLFPRD